MFDVYETRKRASGRTMYKVPAIDNRERGGYATFQILADAYGTKSVQGRLHRIDGQTVSVIVNAFGWGRVDSDNNQRSIII